MSIEYEVLYVARSPASMRQEDFASMVDETCNSRAVSGWTLFSAVGDYGAKVTLGVWLYFSREAEEGSSRSRSSSYTRTEDDLDEGPLDTSLGEDEGSSFDEGRSEDD